MLKYQFSNPNYENKKKNIENTITTNMKMKTLKINNPSLNLIWVWEVQPADMLTSNRLIYILKSVMPLIHILWIMICQNSKDAVLDLILKLGWDAFVIFSNLYSIRFTFALAIFTLYIQVLLLDKSLKKINVQ